MSIREAHRFRRPGRNREIRTCSVLPGSAQVSTKMPRRRYDGANASLNEIDPRKVTLTDVALDLCGDIPLPLFGGLHPRQSGRFVAVP
ncbi:MULTISPECIES: hypothetical protein [Nocardioides]|uniref:Uncharacterized protein n=2 Tax=Nocardioides TaxID=1839 RepID=A0ABT8TTK7_9ACTN|nr:hypothetical protein [Nocardioides cremeus]MDO3397284.1 hypothetical protein [Nocardioides cremeus]